MPIDIGAIENILDRPLTAEEKIFLMAIEDAGVEIAAPFVEPPPTERELIQGADDCEHIVVKPEADNPFGYARGHTYRSEKLGREVVITYDFADITRDGKVVGEEAVVEYVEVRDVAAEVSG